MKGGLRGSLASGGRYGKGVDMPVIKEGECVVKMHLEYFFTEASRCVSEGHLEVKLRQTDPRPRVETHSFAETEYLLVRRETNFKNSRETL